MNRTTLPRRLSLHLLLIAAVLFSAILIGSISAQAKAKAPRYHIKVNTQKCVTTVYQKVKGKWKPIRCMYCAPGKPSTPTPLGTYTLKGRWPWYHMTGADYNVQVRYAIQVHGDYFMHSCCYSSINKKTESKSNFNGLGHGKTHGCIRFSVMDAKWIYENCKAGTKVTFYRSSKTGPLGKPQKKLKVRTRATRGWDPTDPDKKNTQFKMKGAKINISKDKPKEIKYGADSKKTKLSYGVTAINPYANQDVTSLMKLKKLTLNGKKIKTASFSTKKAGKYKATWYVRDKYCTQKGKKGNSKTFTFEVIDVTKLNVSEKKRTVDQGDTDAVSGVTAEALSGDRTDKIKVKILTPSKKTVSLSYKKAQDYTFAEAGTYKITYTVTNSYPEKEITKNATVKVSATEEAA